MKKLMFVIILLCVVCSLLTSCVSDAYLNAKVVPEPEASAKEQMELFEGV